MPRLKTSKTEKRSAKRATPLRKISKSTKGKTSKQKSKSKVEKGKPLRVVELFAGVGGFRVGLENVLGGKAFKVIWSNQYEPGTSKQWASWVYDYHWGKDKLSKHSNKLIEEAIAAKEVPKKFEVLVGGFPCQDYSVAKPNNQSKGIEGKKGVLWWSIYQIAEQSRPPYLILENVDRLVKSPASQRGKDFAIMLRCLQMLGYHVEWRVINAAEYGMPQRRRRVFIVGYHKSTSIGKRIASKSPEDIIRREGVLANAFESQNHKAGKSEEDEDDKPKGKSTKNKEFNQAELTLFEESKLLPILLSDEPHDLTSTFNRGNAVHTPFLTAGFSLARTDKAEVYTVQVYSAYKSKMTLLGDLLDKADKVSAEFHVEPAALKSWIYQKGGKSEKRANYLTTLSQAVSKFATQGIKVALDRKLKNAWTKQLSEYWSQHEAGGPGIELIEPKTGQQLHLSHDEIAQSRFEYEFKEGPLPMPDPLDRPLRTIITSEGGSSPSRFKHIICTVCAEKWAKGKKAHSLHDCVKTGKFRRLTPKELERGNMFKADHTRFAKVPEAAGPVEVDSGARAFFMGNALVVGLVKKIGYSLVNATRQ
jgi:DNA (cytosine-5)-methyltransferase 1